MISACRHRWNCHLRIELHLWQVFVCKLESFTSMEQSCCLNTTSHTLHFDFNVRPWKPLEVCYHNLLSYFRPVDDWSVRPPVSAVSFKPTGTGCAMDVLIEASRLNDPLPRKKKKMSSPGIFCLEPRCVTLRRLVTRMPVHNVCVTWPHCFVAFLFPVNPVKRCLFIPLGENAWCLGDFIDLDYKLTSHSSLPRLAVLRSEAGAWNQWANPTKPSLWTDVVHPHSSVDTLQLHLEWPDSSGTPEPWQSKKKKKWVKKKKKEEKCSKIIECSDCYVYHSVCSRLTAKVMRAFVPTQACYFFNLIIDFFFPQQCLICVHSVGVQSLFSQRFLWIRCFGIMTYP